MPANNTGYDLYFENLSMTNVTSPLFDINPALADYPHQGSSRMPQADFILLCGIKNSMNYMMNYDPTDWYSSTAGATLPSGMKSLAENFLGLENVVNQTNLVFSGGDYHALEKIHSYFLDGGAVFMFINSGMISGGTSSVTANHWVSYKGGLNIDVAQQKVSFKVFTWGTIRTVTMSFETFHDNFYGTVSGGLPYKQLSY